MLIKLSKRTNKYTIKLIGCYWTAIDTTVRFCHKADIQETNTFSDIILKQSQNLPVDTHQAKRVMR